MLLPLSSKAEGVKRPYFPTPSFRSKIGRRSQQGLFKCLSAASLSEANAELIERSEKRTVSVLARWEPERRVGANVSGLEIKWRVAPVRGKGEQKEVLVGSNKREKGRILVRSKSILLFLARAGLLEYNSFFLLIIGF
jgi:hypothetical protein